ncbi:MAG: DUF1343 domain-containing protein [Gemmatimonadota bacterium]
MNVLRLPQSYPITSTALLLLGACGGSSEAAPAATGEHTPARVRPGIEVLLTDSIDVVRGRRVALLTNHTGVDGEGRPSIDRLYEHPEVELVALFAPEHGIRGAAEAGELVESGRDEQTGLPIHSLYGDTRKPTPAMLEGIDVLLYDIQDVGTRYYTYLSTMALAMEAAGEAGIPFVVLDRPDPINGMTVQGDVLDPEYSTFVGRYPVPMRYGMTPGEFARLVRGEFGVEVELHVVPLDGWTRDLSFPETGLPWIAPSPNMPSVESALHYPGTCLFEGTNLSVGRGTPEAFQQIGAPWLDGEDLAQAMAAYDLPDVRVTAVSFTPRQPGDGKFGDETVQGVRLTALGPAYDPTRTAVALLIEARRMSGDRWDWREGHFDRLAGSDDLRLGIEAGRSLDAVTAPWSEQRRAFEQLRSRYLIYP